MTPELQSVVDRLETVERQARGWKLLVLVSILLAAAAIAVPIVMPGPGAPAVARSTTGDRGRFSVVEANRFILRDPDGAVAGGMEVGQDGTIKLVLGSAQGTSAAAFLEVQPAGTAHLALRGSAPGSRPGAMILMREDGSGAVQLGDAAGRTRFRAP